MNINELKNKYYNCTMCRLHSTRTNIVFDDGVISNKIIFVGEAPGRNEDIKGKPFIGSAGNLLTNYFNIVNLNREDYYITNIVKCRPPNNRNPRADEIKNCSVILNQQLEIIQPKIIITLGLFATKYFININKNMGDMRGKLFKKDNILILPMYHPAALLRNPTIKPLMFKDFQLLSKIINNQIEEAFLL